MALGEQIANLYISLGADVSGFRKKMSEAAKTVDSVGKNLMKTGTSLTRSITIPLAAIGGASAKLADDFGTSMVKIETLVGKSREQVDKWGREILDLAPSVGRAPQELADALFVVTSAGAKVSESLGIVETAAKAAAVGLGDTITIARATTAVMQAYASTGIDASRATDILLKTVRAGNLEAASLAPTLGRVIGLAAEMGVSFEEVGASIATYTRLGVSAEEATTGLRGILANFKQPAGQAATQAKALGISFAELRMMIRERGLAATLLYMTELTKGNDTALTNLIPNVRALSAVLGTAGVQGESYAEILKAIADPTNELSGAFERWSETSEAVFAKSMAELKSAAINAGNLILPVMTSIVEKITEVIEWWNNLGTASRTVIVAFGGIAAAAGPTLIALGAIARAYYAVAAAAVFMGNTTRAALLKSGIGIAIIALGAMAAYIFDNWDKLRVGWGVIWDELVITSLRAVDKVLMAMQALTAFIPGLSATFGEARSGIEGLINAQKHAGVMRATAYYAKQTAEETDGMAEATAEAERVFASLMAGIPPVTGALEDHTGAVSEVTEVYNNLEEEQRRIAAKQLIMGASFNAAAERVELLEEALISLAAKGLGLASEGMQKLQKDLDAARLAAKAFEQIQIRKDVFGDLADGLDAEIARLRATELDLPITKARIEPDVQDIPAQQLDVTPNVEEPGTLDLKVNPVLGQIDTPPTAIDLETPELDPLRVEADLDVMPIDPVEVDAEPLTIDAPPPVDAEVTPQVPPLDPVALGVEPEVASVDPLDIDAKINVPPFDPIAVDVDPEVAPLDPIDVPLADASVDVTPHVEPIPPFGDMTVKVTPELEEISEPPAIPVEVHPMMAGLERAAEQVRDRLKGIGAEFEVDADFEDAITSLQKYLNAQDGLVKNAALAKTEVSLLEQSLTRLLENNEPVDSEPFQFLVQWLIKAREESRRLDLAERFEDIETKARILGPAFDAGAERVRVLETALINLAQAPNFELVADEFEDLSQQLIDSLAQMAGGVQPLSTEFIGLVEQAASLRGELMEMGDVDPASTATMALANLQAGLAEVEAQKDTYGTKAEYAAARTALFTQALINLRAAGMDPASEAFQRLLAQMGAAADFQWKIEPPDMTEVDAWAKKSAEIARAISHGIDQAVGSFVEGIAKMANGTASAKDISKAVMGTLADLAIRVGKIAIGTGAAVEGIKRALQSLNPIAAIAAGAALIALGTWAKSSLASAANGGGGGGSFNENTSIGNFQTPRIEQSYGGEAPRQDRTNDFMRSTGPTEVLIANWPAEDPMAAPQEVMIANWPVDNQPVVEILPRAVPSGDIEYAQREGQRRANRNGTEVI